MKIKYLGTAAAEGVPALFCDCPVCKKSRELGGKNIRTRSQAIIDDDLLVDFPADTYMHFLQNNILPEKIRSCIITHSHEDHLYPMEISIRKTGFAHFENNIPLEFFSDTSGYEMLSEVKTRLNISDEDVLLNKIELYKPFKVGDYTVTAIRATHDPKSTPVVYIIEKGGKRLFYANDTSRFPKEAMEYLAGLKKRCDVISLDCTEGDRPIGYEGHMNLERCIDMRRELSDMGLADEKTVFILNHFSHNGGKVIYDEFKEVAAKEGFLVSYDGMEIEF